MSIDKITELELQAAGLEKQGWKFGYSTSIYKDVYNTFMVDDKTGSVILGYRNNDKVSEGYKR